LALGVGSAAAGQNTQATGAATDIKKVTRQTVWERGPGGNQVPLWPEGLTIQRPECDKPEEVGNGSKLVAVRPWTWASNVARPTMTIYPAKGQNAHAAILVLPGGGYAAVAMDLEGTENLRLDHAMRRVAPSRVSSSPWVEISPNAPPTLLIHAMNDPTDDVRHSMAYGLALHGAGVSVDMRFYAKGGHAFGIRATSAPTTTEWPEIVVRWLRTIAVR
jgi:acetyl esterase/lipase